MAGVKIGLDFGTHQTKICIVDNSDRRNRRYFFHKFTDLNGEISYTLPSLVQINNDDTLSYGFFDASKAKRGIIGRTQTKKQEPTKPKLQEYKQFPEIKKPVKPSILEQEPIKGPIVLNTLSSLKNAINEKEQNTGDSFAKRKQEAKKQYESDCIRYKQLCIEREQAIERNKDEVDTYNKKLQKKYDEEVKIYNYQIKEEPFIYRYFKQTVFSSGMKWRHDINAMTISIWYLTYVFFLLDKKYGTENLIVSMGTSSSRDTWDKNKRKASEIILSVYNLIENVFQHDMDKFLKSSVHELLTLTKIVPFSQKAKEDSAIFVFPEAIANLQPLAVRKAFGSGLNLVIDIGGGTTDISLFTAFSGNNVQIYDYFSLPNGINSVVDNGPQSHTDAVSRNIQTLTTKLRQYASHLQIPQSQISKMLHRRNVIFTGGGSSRQELIRSYHDFTEIILFKTRFFELMPSDNIEHDVHSIIHVMSTALGLAMMTEDDSEIPLMSYENLFSNAAEAYSKTTTHNGGEHYSHGLSDW